MTAEQPSARFGRPLWRRLGLVGIALAAALALSACADEHPLDTLTEAGPDAQEINDLFFPVLGVAIIVFFLVQGAIVYLVFKYRARRREAAAAARAEEHSGDGDDLYGDDEYPAQVHGNLRLELAWTIIPTILLAVISVFTLISLVELNEVSAAEDDLRVTVVGQQWWWEFQYHLDGDTSTPPDIVTANELVMPVRQQVPLEITSRDVIHSFWIPRLNGKRDAVPGRTHPWVIEANEVGRYMGQCTEFCGLSHAYMRMYAVVLSPEEWEEWVQGQIVDAAPLEPGDPGFEGQEVFLANCANCHVVNGVTDVNLDGRLDGMIDYAGANSITSALVAGAAPNLTHFASRTTFAGSIFDVYEGRAEWIPYLEVAERGNLNRGHLAAWIRNAPERKANDADGARGMTAFPGLTEGEIDSLVEYLTTLR
ncbi:MAG: cytochrome c oxidase subunit II [bacterium]|nr:cytochrome c oxidase subunit II [bacterium]